MKAAIQTMLQNDAVATNQATFNALVRRRFGLQDSRMLEEVLECSPTLGSLTAVLERALLEKRRARHASTCLFEERLAADAVADTARYKLADGREERVRVELALASDATGVPYVHIDNGNGIDFSIHFRFCPMCGCSLTLIP